METIERVLVSLDPVSGDEILLKRTPGEYMGRPVDNLLDYMLDASSDDMNPGYNEGELRAVTIIKTWREKAKSNENDEFIITAKPIEGGNPIKLDLDGRLDAYKSRILQSRPVPGEDQSVTSPYIELFASYKEGGRAVTHLQYRTELISPGR